MKYNCELCGDEYKRQSSLKQHIEKKRCIGFYLKNVTPGSLKCKCGKKFEKNTYILTHLKDKICDYGKKLKIPSYSDAPYSRSNDTSEESATCGYCGKSFVKARYMITHLKAGRCQEFNAIQKDVQIDFESEDRRCFICNKVFQSVPSLNSHMKTCESDMVNSKVVDCSDCGKSFLSGTSLYGHIKNRICGAKKVSFYCAKCSETFQLIKSWKTHMIETHEINADVVDKMHMQCQCGILFVNKDCFVKHLKACQNIEIESETYEFFCIEDFKLWLANEEQTTDSVYITQNSKQLKTHRVFYMGCSQTELCFLRKNVDNLKDVKLMCTSGIILNVYPTGNVIATYYKSHYGHEQIFCSPIMKIGEAIFQKVLYEAESKSGQRGVLKSLESIKNKYEEEGENDKSRIIQHYVNCFNRSVSNANTTDADMIPRIGRKFDIWHQLGIGEVASGRKNPLGSFFINDDGELVQEDPVLLVHEDDVQMVQEDHAQVVGVNNDDELYGLTEQGENFIYVEVKSGKGDISVPKTYQKRGLVVSAGGDTLRKMKKINADEEVFRERFVINQQEGTWEEGDSNLSNANGDNYYESSFSDEENDAEIVVISDFDVIERSEGSDLRSEYYADSNRASSCSSPGSENEWNICEADGEYTELDGIVDYGVSNNIYKRVTQVDADNNAVCENIVQYSSAEDIDNNVVINNVGETDDKNNVLIINKVFENIDENGVIFVNNVGEDFDENNVIVANEVCEDFDENGVAVVDNVCEDIDEGVAVVNNVFYENNVVVANDVYDDTDENNVVVANDICEIADKTNVNEYAICENVDGNATIEYIVTSVTTQNGDEIIHNFSCSCPSYESEFTCQHIEMVLASGL